MNLLTTLRELVGSVRLGSAEQTAEELVRVALSADLSLSGYADPHGVAVVEVRRQRRIERQGGRSWVVLYDVQITIQARIRATVGASTAEDIDAAWQVASRVMDVVSQSERLTVSPGTEVIEYQGTSEDGALCAHILNFSCYEDSA